MTAVRAIDELLRTGEIGDLGDGRLLLSGRALAVYRWVDRQLEALALESGATMIRVPALIARETLERAGYFEAFGEDLGGHFSPRTSQEMTSEVFLLTPALCYYSYAMLANRRLEGPVVLTCAGTCVRREQDGAPSLARLWEFTMREVIVVGTADWVRDERERWIGRVRTLASSIGLEGQMHAAADPFFAGKAEGRRLMQQIKELKYELSMDVGAAEAAAVASFNLHEGFFGTRFQITMADGSCAQSGCVAFGLERWMLAIVAQCGLARAAELAGV